MQEKEIWEILRCYNCKRCVDKETCEIVPEPKDGIVMSHTLCKDCEQEVKAKLEAEVSAIEALLVESTLAGLLAKKEPPAGMVDRICRVTLRHYETRKGAA